MPEVSSPETEIERNMLPINRAPFERSEFPETWPSGLQKQGPSNFIFLKNYNAVIEEACGPSSPRSSRNLTFSPTSSLSHFLFSKLRRSK